MSFGRGRWWDSVLIRLWPSYRDFMLRRSLNSSILDSNDQYEFQFRAFADAMPQLAWIAKPDGTRIWFNKGWYEFTGTTAAQMAGLGWQDVHDPEELPRTLEFWQNAVASRKPMNLECRIRSVTGDFECFLTRATPILNSRGEVVRWIGTNTNIQEQKKLEVHLSAAIDSRDELFSIASHELKTPMTALKLNVQMMQRALKNDSVVSAEKMNHSLEAITRQVRKLENFVDELLDVAQLRSGKDKFDKERVHLASMLREVIEQFTEQLQNNGCEVSLKVDENVFGFWDQSRIEQVITNLISNAIKYAPGLMIEVKAGQVDQSESGTIFISVRDHGPGIAPEMQKLIFDRFERASNNKSRVSGLGLGLFIAKQIVKAHEGEIVVESDLKFGSTFTVYLPQNAKRLFASGVESERICKVLSQEEPSERARPQSHL